MIRSRRPFGAPVSLLVAAAGAMLLGFSQTTPTTWAVVVGVNDYVNYDDETGDLRGAENDALAFRDVLVDVWGVPPSQVTTLLSREATRDAIEEAFTEWLPEHVTRNDRVVFFFAGHGSQVLDRDGDEADGLDETICPTDVLVSSFERDIRDDELDAWIRALPTRNVVVVLDSCHSGTGTRMGVGYARTRSLRRGGDATPTVTPSPTRREGRALASAEGVLEMAGAAPDQFAMDMRFHDPATGDGFYGGAFTTHLVRQIRRAPVDATFQDIYWATVHAMKADRFAQDPQISGPVDLSPRFGSLPEQTSAPLTVVSVQSSQVLLAVGTVGPLEPGMALTSEEGSVLRVDQVDGERALATPVQGSVKVGETLELLGSTLPTRTLRLRLEGIPAPLAAELADLARDLPALVLVRDSEAPADLALRMLEDGQGVGIYARDGSLRAELEADRDAVAGKLRRELDIHRLAGLGNTRPSFPVQVGIVGDGNALPLGAPLLFRVRSEAEGYLTLLDLGTDGTLTLLYPNRWSAELKLSAGEEVVLPRGEDEFVFRTAPPSGLGMVRAIVTRSPLPLATRGEPFLSSREGHDPVEEVRDALLAGLGDSGASGPEDHWVPVGEWATALATYRILSPDEGGS